MKKLFYILPAILAMALSFSLLSCGGDDEEKSKVNTKKYDVDLRGTTWMLWPGGCAFDKDMNIIYFYNFNRDGFGQTLVYQKVEEQDYYEKVNTFSFNYRQSVVPLRITENLDIDGCFYDVTGLDEYAHVGCREDSMWGYTHEFDFYEFHQWPVGYSTRAVQVHFLPTSDYIDYMGNDYNFYNGGGGSDSGNTDDDSDDDNSKCSICYGTGKCTATNCLRGSCARCGGTGIGTMGKKCYYCNNGKCRTCGGTGKCKYCDGTGRL